MNNFDMSQIMSILSKMDKKDLEAGIKQANEVLKNKGKEEIIDDINKNK
jgi:hypothetical protein